MRLSVNGLVLVLFSLSLSFSGWRDPHMQSKLICCLPSLLSFSIVLCCCRLCFFVLRASCAHLIRIAQRRHGMEWSIEWWRAEKASRVKWREVRFFFSRGQCTFFYFSRVELG